MCRKWCTAQSGCGSSPRSIGDYDLIYTNSVVRTNANVGKCVRIGSNVTICNNAVVPDGADVPDCTAVHPEVIE